MADQDDFTFDEQGGDSEEWHEEAAEETVKKGGSSRRLLLLLLLLVVVAAGAYYMMMMPSDDAGPAAPSKVVVQVQKKPVAIPAKPAGKPASAEPSPAAAAPAPAPEKSAAPMPTKPEGEPMPTKPEGEPMPAKPEGDPMLKTSPAPMPDPPVKEEIVAARKPAAVPPSPPAEEKVFETPAASKPAPAVAPQGAYTLTAGTYLLDSSIQRVSEKILSLGYDPVLTPVKRKVTMTRLKVGTFPKAEAEAKIAELKPVAPDTFGIQHGDRETVYVGSYLILDKARRFADVLYQKGITLEEEQIEVEQTLQRVTFGSFASADAAAAAGRQAAARKLQAKVIMTR